jgi:hypothetical protein
VPHLKKLSLLCAVIAALTALELLNLPFPLVGAVGRESSGSREVGQTSALRPDRRLREDAGVSGCPAVSCVLSDVTETVTDWRTYQPECITVSPYPGLALPFHMVRVNVENDVTTWVGRNGLRGASLVGIGKRDRWDGVLSMIGGSFNIHIHGNDVKVIEHSGPFDCGGAVLPRREAKPEGNASALVSKETGRTGQAVPTIGNPGIHTSGTTIYTCDVVFFYSAEWDSLAVEVAGSIAALPSYLDSTYRAYLETNNLILEQSLVPNLRWRFVGMVKMPDYKPFFLDNNGPHGAARYGMTEDLNILDDTTDQGGTVARFVALKEAELSADLSVVVAGLPRNFGGLSDFAGHRCVLDHTSGNVALAHEMGHNFGLNHDRETLGAKDGDRDYSYGYLFHYDPTKFGGDALQYKIGDLMSYGSPMPYYSNPNVSLTGTAINAGNITLPDSTYYALGVAADQPKAAYSARVLWEQAAEKSSRINPANEVFPSVFAQPVSTEAASVGGHVRLGVAAAGSNLTYQWRKNGMNLAGATSSSLDLANASAADAGAYDAAVTNILGSVITQAAAVTVSSEPALSRVANISTRSLVGVGDSVQIAGFVVSGSSTKTVLIRASGPALTALRVSGALADPVLELHGGPAILATNDDWSSDPAKADAIRNAGAAVGAFTWASGSKDAAILVTLNPGTYSAVISGKNGGTGVALVEVYEVSPDTSTLANISTRATVGTNDNVQIAGFVIGGAIPKTVLIRASGPALTALGVSGALADPVLELHGGPAILATNDDWSSDPAKADAIRNAGAAVGAFAWASGSKDAAILITLSPGTYSAVISGKNGGTGVALVEVYDASGP